MKPSVYLVTYKQIIHTFTSSGLSANGRFPIHEKIRENDLFLEHVNPEHPCQQNLQTHTYIAAVEFDMKFIQYTIIGSFDLIYLLILFIIVLTCT